MHTALNLRVEPDYIIIQENAAINATRKDTKVVNMALR